MRLKSEIWVRAYLRRCQTQNVPAVVVRRGDEAAGAIFICVDRLDGTVSLYGPAPAGCLFATIISRDGAGGISLAESDLMLCGGLCDCNDDCPAEADYCMDENAADPTASIQALFGRGGYCRPLIDANGETEDDSISTCP